MWVRVSLHLAYMDFWISDFGQRNMMKAQVVYGGKFIAGNKNISSRDLINHVEITSKHYPFSVALGYNSSLLLQAFNDQILFALMVASLLTALLLAMLYSYNKTRRIRLNQRSNKASKTMNLRGTFSQLYAVIRKDGSAQKYFFAGNTL